MYVKIRFPARDIGRISATALGQGNVRIFFLVCRASACVVFCCKYAEIDLYDRVFILLLLSVISLRRGSQKN